MAANPCLESIFILISYIPRRLLLSFWYRNCSYREILPAVLRQINRVTRAKGISILILGALQTACIMQKKKMLFGDDFIIILN